MLLRHRDAELLLLLLLWRLHRVWVCHCCQLQAVQVPVTPQLVVWGTQQPVGLTDCLTQTLITLTTGVMLVLVVLVVVVAVCAPAVLD
jgi:hypothetical protein